MPKLCKDCTHFRPSEFTMDACASPANGIDLVSGNIKIVTAAFERSPIGKCGEDGVKFDQRVVQKDKLIDPLLITPSNPSWVERVFRALRGW